MNFTSPVMRDFIIEDLGNKSRHQFVKSVDEKSILRLASLYHSDEPCKIFRPTEYGSYNACFFVEFIGPSSIGRFDRWVVRIPIPARVPWINEKLDAEIATMKYIAANTSIPIPQVRAYSFIEDSPIQMAFIIMDYVEGKNLKQLGFPKDVDTWCSATTQPTRARKVIYEQLASLYAQLRRLEFPEIGALGLPRQDESAICVRHRPLSIEVLLQQGEGLEPAIMFREKTTFKTSRDYINALLWLGDNLLSKGKNSMVDSRGGDRTLYATHSFKRFVTEQWFDLALDHGPFVLMHGDLGIQNLLWDENLNLVAVIDWEWSSVIPLQLLVPPPWLNGQDTSFLCYSQTLYNREVGILCDMIRDKEKTLGLRRLPLLSQEWARLKDRCPTLVACALLRPEHVFDVYWSFLSYHAVGFKPSTATQWKEYDDIVSQRLKAFMEDGDKTALLARKEEEQREYDEAEQRYFRSKMPPTHVVTHQA